MYYLYFINIIQSNIEHDMDEIPDQKNSLVKQQELNGQLSTIEPTHEKLITHPTCTIEAKILQDL